MRAQYLSENADRPLRLTGDGQVKWLDYKNIIYSTSFADPDPLESEPFSLDPDLDPVPVYFY